MVNKNDKLQEVYQLLEDAADMYYNKGTSIMSDEDFDLLVKYYEEESGELFEVGALVNKPSGVIDVSHSYQNLVGTLYKANNMEDVREFIESKLEPFKDQLSNDIYLGISFKYDGNSVTGEYNSDGTLDKMLTRGRNGKGLDLTHIFKDHKITEIDNKGSDFAIKYEAIVTYKDYDRIKEDLQINYANPRSLVSGLLGRDDAYKYRDYITLVPLEVKFKDEELNNPMNNFKINKAIKGSKYVNSDIFVGMLFTNNDFKSNHGYFDLEESIDQLIYSIEGMYNEMDLEMRSELNYMIDGLVITILNPSNIVSELGYTNDRPNYSIALKFPYMEKSSKVIDIEYDYGKTGRITPMVTFEPVTFNGAVQKRVSLSNYKRFKELNLSKGSPILVQYRNDTLSYVEPLIDTRPNPPKAFEFIEECPVCQADIIIENGTLAFCSNSVCEGKIVGRIERYLTVLDVKGIKGGILDKLHTAGHVNEIIDLYNLDLGEVSMIPGLGEKSAQLIDKALNDRIEIYDYELLAGIGIQDFNVHTSKILMSNFTLKEIMDNGYYRSNNFRNEVLTLEGIQDITLSKIIVGLDNYGDELLKLMDTLTIKSYKEGLSKNISEETYNFCITGSLNLWKNRKELKEELELKGHKVTGGVSKNTDYLINNDEHSTSSKNKKAKELEIPIVDENYIKDNILN